MERLVFPYITYTNPPTTLFPRKIPSGFIYTMNRSEQELKKNPSFGWHIDNNEWFLSRLFGHAESLLSCDTYQFDDYSKYVSSMFDPVAKAKRRQDIFPRDCEKAFEMGAMFAKEPCV